MRQSRIPVDDRNTAAEAAHGLGQFQADIPATQNQKMDRNVVKIERLNVRQGACLGQAGIGSMVARLPVLMTTFSP